MAATTALAGRRHELAALAGVVAGRGDAVAMVVTGEAGVGKSRLVAAAAASAAETGVTTLTGWCLPLSQGLPFLPVIEVLRRLGEIDERRLLNSLLGDCPAFVRGELIRLMPEMDESGEQTGPAEPDDGWRRQRLFDALRLLLSALAKVRRVAVVVEDVHWADHTSLEFLSYLMTPGRAPGAPLVLTCRTDEELTPALTDWLHRLYRDPRARRLDLLPLTRVETAEQIALLLGRPASRQFADELYLRSEGNAFFTEQLVAFERTDSERQTVRDELPAGLSALLLSRTTQVTGVARDVMVALAVAARPMQESALAQICRTDQASVRAALRELLAARLLRRPDRAGRYQLRHALLAEAVGGELLPDERRALHGRVAEVMAGWPDAGLAAEIAAHFAQANVSSEELRWRVLAGREADGVFASTEAAEHWRRAITLWDRVAEPEALTGQDLVSVYMRAAAAADHAGEESVSAGLAEQALTRFAATASPETAVRLYGEVGYFRSVRSFEAGRDALTKAIEIGERIPPTPDYVRAMHRLAHIRANQGHLEDQRPLITRALQAAEKIGDLAGQKLLQMDLAWMAMADGQIEDAVTDLGKAAQLVIDPENPRADVTAAETHTDILLKLGDLEGAVDVGLHAIDQAAKRGISDSLLRGNVYEALTERGEVDQAAAVIDPVTDGMPTRDSWVLYLDRADLDMRRGRLTDAVAFWAAREELIADGVALWLRYECALRRLELELWRGEPTAALPEAISALAAVCRTYASPFAGPLFVLTLRACADAADHARATGDTADLESVVKEGAQLSELRVAATVDPFADLRTPATIRADFLSWQAEASRLRGGSDTLLWQRAAAAWDDLRRPHRAAYARWRHAQALFDSPHGRAAAAAVLRSAAAQAVQHVPLANAISDLARRARIEVTRPDLSAQSKEPLQALTFGLTERELAVLRLLGQGKTNSEIGAELFISRKTASVHVTNILRKLKVSSRVQAAAVAAHAGLLTSTEIRDQ